MLDKTLSNGYTLPHMAIGTNWMKKNELVKILVSAIEAGFRAFDTARDYGSEDVVGDAVKESLAITGLGREDVFITTKIGNSQQVKGDIKGEVELSLRNLKTDYIDLYLMHWPYPGYFIQTWRKMIEIYSSTDKVRAIGVANYDSRHLVALADSAPELMPMVNQVEFHPLRTIQQLRQIHSKWDITLEAYAPLCRLMPPLKDNEFLKRLGEKYTKSVGQIILRWHIQHGSIPVFKTYNPARFKENIQIFDFELSELEMSKIDSLNMDYKYHVESTNCPGY